MHHSTSSLHSRHMQHWQGVPGCHEAAWNEGPACLAWNNQNTSKNGGHRRWGESRENIPWKENAWTDGWCEADSTEPQGKALVSCHVTPETPVCGGVVVVA